LTYPRKASEAGDQASMLDQTPTGRRKEEEKGREEERRREEERKGGVLERSQVPQEEQRAFARSPKLARTPPKHTRSLSLPDDLMEVVTSAGRTEDTAKTAEIEAKGSPEAPTKSGSAPAPKRKRVEAEAAAQPAEGPSKVPQFVEELAAKIRSLDKFTKENRNVHKEIKDAVKDLTAVMRRLRAEQERQAKKMCAASDIKARRAVMRDAAVGPELQDGALGAEAAARCQRCREMGDMRVRRLRWKGADSYADFLEVPEDEWSAGVFQIASSKVGEVCEAPAEARVVLPCRQGIVASSRRVSRALDSIGGRGGLIAQGKRPGEVAVMEQTLGFPGEDGDMIFSSKRIYCPIVCDQVGAPTREGAFDAFKWIREDMCRRGEKLMVIPALEGDEWPTQLRMVSYLFADSGIGVWVYEPPEGSGRQRQGTSTGAQRRTSQPIRRNPRHDALVVSMEGATYADLVKRVREVVDPEAAGAVVKDMRQTRKGELLLAVGNGPEKAEALRQQIAEKVPQTKAALLKSTRVIHLRGLDAAVTEREIKDAVAREIGAEEGVLEVRALRPAYGCRQNATLMMPDAAARKLLQRSRMKIGWTDCRIAERERETRCFRCWEVGHIKAQCRGPSREGLCLKCGQEGHKVRDCVNEAFCVLCKEAGHRTGTLRCPRGRGRGSTGIRKRNEGTPNKH